jgi:hypothetical protein
MLDQRTIDAHAHILAEDTMALMRKEAPQIGPRVERIDDDFAVLEVAGSRYRPFPRGGWDNAAATERHGCRRRKIPRSSAQAGSDRPGPTQRGRRRGAQWRLSPAAEPFGVEASRVPHNVREPARAN